MAVHLRLTRTGRHKRPLYRVVAADSRKPRDGRFLEILGIFDPMKEPAVPELKQERVLSWLRQGAQPTVTVRTLLRRWGVWKQFEAEKATLAAAKMHGPVYIRLAREKTPVLTTGDTPFEIGKAIALWNEPEGTKPDVALIACGSLVHNALLAASQIEAEGIKVRLVNNVSVKPMDEETIIAAAKDAGAIVTVEEHQIAGGMGSAVAEVLAKNYPVPIEFIGMQNRFGESGEPNELIEHFGMGVSHIVEAAKKAIGRKK